MIDAKIALESSIHNLIMRNETRILRAIESGETYTYIDINIPESFYNDLLKLGYKIDKSSMAYNQYVISWNK